MFSNKSSSNYKDGSLSCIQCQQDAEPYPGDTDTRARNLKRDHDDDCKTDTHPHTHRARDREKKKKLFIAHKTGTCSVNFFIKYLIQA